MREPRHQVDKGTEKQRIALAQEHDALAGIDGLLDVPCRLVVSLIGRTSVLVHRHQNREFALPVFSLIQQFAGNMTRL